MKRKTDTLEIIIDNIKQLEFELHEKLSLNGSEHNAETVEIKNRIDVLRMHVIDAVYIEMRRNRKKQKQQFKKVG